MKVCLTGGIACGKSLAARYLNEFGVATIDADDIVHELIPDPAERRRLAAEVFADPAKRLALEAKLHPLVKERIEEFMRGLEGLAEVWKVRQRFDEGLANLPNLPNLPNFPNLPNLPNFPNLPNLQNLRLPIIPLLFETHWDEEYDIICCVASERETQISRMTATRGYTREEAEARLAAQMPVAEKAAKSHYVIHNDSTPEELKEKIKGFLIWQTNLMSLRGR